MARAPVETVPATFPCLLSTLVLPSLQLLTDLEQVHTGTQDQNLGLPSVFPILVPDDAFLGLVS